MGWIKIATLLTDPQINADWNATVGVAEILNKPTLFSGDYNDLSNKPVITGGGVTSYLDLTDKPTIPTSTSQLTNNSNYQTGTQVASSITTAIASKVNAGDLAAVATSGSYLDLSNTPAPVDITGKADKTYVDTQLATKGTSNFSGAYADLTGKPTIPTVPTTVSSFTNDANYLVAADIAGKADASSLATVATTGSYDDLLNKPVITSTIAGATDAVITTPANNQVLTYDSALSKWKNATAAGGAFYGGGSITTNSALGTNALANHSASASGANNVAVGADAAAASYANNHNVVVGWEAGKTLSSGIISYTVNTAGTGYTGTPILTVSAPAAGGVQATATVNVIGGGVSYFTALVPGSKYDSTATATISGTGTGAVVTPVVNTGSYNTVLGAQALRNSVYSFEQVAIGYKALTAHTGQTNSATDFPNTAVGTRTLTSATSAKGCTAVGYEAAKTVTTTTDVTAIGNKAGTAGLNISGSTLVGSLAGTNVSTAYVTAIGYYAGSMAAANTTWLGAQAGFLNSGAGNVGVGYSAIGGSGNAAYNTAVGHSTLNAITTGSYNTAIGYEALKAQLTGNYNTALGCQSLKAALGAATHNTAAGYLSGTAITTGTSNTLIGASAGVALTIGYENTFIGTNAGQGHIEGSNNTCIGYGSTPSSPSVTNQVTLGNTNVTALRCAVTAITSTSDIRDKTRIAPLPTGLDFVMNLRPVSFVWNSRDGAKVGIPSAGFIAQDLLTAQEVAGADYLDLVSTDNPEKLEARYGNLIAPMVKAIQQLCLQNEMLQLDIVELKRKLDGIL